MKNIFYRFFVPFLWALLCVLPVSVQAAYSTVQLIDAGTASSGTALTSSSYTLTAGTRVILITVFANGTDTSSTMTDTNGNTWSKVAASGYSAASGMYFVAWECKNVTTGGSTTITQNWSSAVTQRGFAGYEVTGLSASAAVQTLAHNYQSSPGLLTDAITTGTNSLTPTLAPAMIFGLVQDQGNSDPFTDGTGFTGVNAPNISIVNGSSYTRISNKRVTTTASTAVTATSATFGASHDYVSYGVVIGEPVVSAVDGSMFLLFP